MFINKWREDVFRQIQSVIESGPGTAAFDFDNTLVFGDLGEAVMFHIALEGLINADADFWEAIAHPLVTSDDLENLHRLRDAWQKSADPIDSAKFAGSVIGLYQKIMDSGGLEDAYRWTKIIFAGRTAQDLRSIASRVFEDEQKREIKDVPVFSAGTIKTGVRVYTEIHDLISAFLSRGWTVRIVTASPEEAIRPVVKEWGLEENMVLGMKLERKGDWLLPRISEPMTFGQGKVEKLKQNGIQSLDFAAGDSFTDWEMMKFAKKALLLDRGSAALREKAVEAGFLIQPIFI